MSIKFDAFFVRVDTFAGPVSTRRAGPAARPTNDLAIRDFRPYSGPCAEWSHLVMTKNDDGTKACHIDVLVEERDEKTRAKARLSWAGKTLVGVGLARLDPADQPVATIGDELAIARALSDLANQLFAATSTDIQASTHEPVTGLHH